MENIKKYVFEGCHQGYLYVSKMLLLHQITVLTSICAPPTLTKMAKNMIKNTIFSSKLYMVIRNILEMLEKRFHWEKRFFNMKIWQINVGILDGILHYFISDAR